MKISKTVVDAFGYISLSLLLILFILVWLNIIPAYLQLPLFFLALTLFLVRVTLRLLGARQKPEQPRE